jgi:hypothetical protein
MLYLHEVHEVHGAHEDAFEAAFRDQWMPALGADRDARLLYFLHHAHGTGAAYNVVTLTAVRDSAAWDQLAQRVQSGDLRAWAEAVDRLRHDVTAKILVPLPWSSLQSFDLEKVPVDRADHEPTLFMEDTVWPFEGRLEDYVAASGVHYAVEMKRRAAEKRAILDVQAAFRTAFGSHRRREIVLWQKIVQPQALVPLLTREVPEELKRPGSWMHDALGLRDRWQSRLLRTARWSPWW